MGPDSVVTPLAFFWYISLHRETTRRFKSIANENYAASQFCCVVSIYNFRTQLTIPYHIYFIILVSAEKMVKCPKPYKPNSISDSPVFSQKITIRNKNISL